MESSISHDADLLEHEQLPLLEQRKELDELTVELTEHIQVPTHLFAILVCSCFASGTAQAQGFYPTRH